MILLKIVVMEESLVMSLGIERFDLMCLHTEFRLESFTSKFVQLFVEK